MTRMGDPHDPILDTHMAAAATNLTPRRIQQLVKAGQIPNYGRPRRILVRLSDVTRVCGDPHHLT